MSLENSKFNYSQLWVSVSRLKQIIRITLKYSKKLIAIYSELDQINQSIPSIYNVCHANDVRMREEVKSGTIL